MNKAPKFPLLATAATKAILADPVFESVLRHWQEIAHRIVVVVPAECAVPMVKKVRYHQVKADIPSLGDVVLQINRVMDAMTPQAAIADPYSVFKWRIFDIFSMAERRQLAKSWMATSHPIALKDFDTPLKMDESFLSFFCGSASLWEFMSNREMPDEVPFITPAWSGWLGNWASKHVHGHKYHDVTDLQAVGRLEAALEEEVSLNGIGPLTFNPPRKNYVTRIPARI